MNNFDIEPRGLVARWTDLVRDQILREMALSLQDTLRYR